MGRPPIGRVAMTAAERQRRWRAGRQGAAPRPSVRRGGGVRMGAEYVAGFFDGEGCVNITTRGKGRQFVLRVMIANTDYDFLHKIQTAYGGTLSRRRHAIGKNWKPFCCLTWTSNAAADFLEQIRPKVLLKAAQVDLGLQFHAFHTRPKSERCRLSANTGLAGRAMTYVRTQGTIEIEEGFKLALSKLNRKGLKSGAAEHTISQQPV